jgi:hypothetical protein
VSEKTAQQDAFEERAAIMEFDGGMTRAQAESQARIALMPAEKITPGYAAFLEYRNKRYARFYKGGSRAE